MPDHLITLINKRHQPPPLHERLIFFFSNLQKQSNQAEGHWKLISCDWRIIVAKKNLGT